MKRVASLAGAVALAAMWGGLALAAPPRGEGPVPKFQCEVAETPQWLSRPTGADIQRLYPHGGATGEQARGLLNCTIGADGGLQDCSVAEMRPEGRGFEEATLALAPLFRVTPPRCKDGTPALGGTVTIPVRWQIG